MTYVQANATRPRPQTSNRKHITKKRTENEGVRVHKSSSSRPLTNDASVILEHCEKWLSCRNPNTPQRQRAASERVLNFSFPKEFETFMLFILYSLVFRIVKSTFFVLRLLQWPPILAVLGGRISTRTSPVIRGLRCQGLPWHRHPWRRTSPVEDRYVLEKVLSLE